MRALVRRGVIVTGTMARAKGAGATPVYTPRSHPKTNARLPPIGASMKPAGTSARRNSSPRTSSVAHPGFLIRRIAFIVVLISERLAQTFQAVEGILPFFATLRTLEWSAQWNPRASGNRRSFLRLHWRLLADFCPSFPQLAANGLHIILSPVLYQIDDAREIGAEYRQPALKPAAPAT